MPSVPGPVWAYSYLRFSSSAQADGDSIRRQTALRDAWLKRHPEVQLDTTLKLEDKGVSGFRGTHHKDKRHALAQFLDLVERGRVPVGSYLIVENLDRLTREEPEESIPLVMNLIRMGIRIVQLAPAEVVYESGMDFGRLMVMLWELARGHGESKRKSTLCGPVWAEKKVQARNNRVPHGKNVPAWVELVDGKYREKPGAARAVRLIFKWSIEGLGSLGITTRLNREAVPTVGRAKKWNRSYVAKILDNRAVLGEYQPMLGHHGRVPDGDPIPDYFPRIISDADWHRAHQAGQVRNKRSGRPGKKGTGTYVLQGLLRCALDECPLHVITRKGKKYIISANAVGGHEGSHWRPFPLEPFVSTILSQLRELEASQLFSDPGAAKVTELEGRLGEVERRLRIAVERFDADPESPTWADRVSQYDKEKRQLVAELTEAKREAANPLSATWSEAVALMAQDEPDRLRAALLATIEGVYCVIVPRGRDRLCSCQVHFKGGGDRDYLIMWRPAVTGAAGNLPAKLHVQSLREWDVLDLRDSAEACMEEDSLLSYPQDAIDRLLKQT